MSAFGKYGVGGKVPGNYKAGESEAPADVEAATLGTTIGNPNTKPVIKTGEGMLGSHN